MRDVARDGAPLDQPGKSMERALSNSKTMPPQRQVGICNQLKWQRCTSDVLMNKGERSGQMITALEKYVNSDWTSCQGILYWENLLDL